MRRLLLAATLFPLALPVCAAPAAAQERPGSLLLVRVLDEQGHPLMGARVTVGGVDREARSDGSGVARMERIPEGLRLVDVRRQGYALQRVASTFTPGDTVHREVVMKPDPVEIEGITVTTWGRSTRLIHNGFYERQRRGLGAYMTRDQIERFRPYHLQEAFRYMRGFSVNHSRTHDIVVATRGGIGNCVPHVYLDGNRMLMRRPEDQADALESIPPENVEAIEAYQGPATIPAEYNLNGTCAVILVWTRGA
jgi:hypothetical protein